MRVILIAALLGATATAGELRITVYDQAHLPKEVRETASYDLRRILHLSGIDIRLLAGDPESEEGSLFVYPGAPAAGYELAATCHARRDIALKIVAVAPEGLPNTVLGIALPLARRGVNVKVFDDHIRDAAFRENLPHALVLSHVIAHEIGHVLLRTNAHTEFGLMSSVWAKREYDSMDKRSLFFEKEQSDEMRGNLLGSACPNVVTTEPVAVQPGDPN